MRPKRAPDKTCSYCGRKPGKTRDHVPPKSLFPHPRPSDLITVPCCQPCNNRKGREEDFFLSTFLFTDAGTTQHGALLWDQTMRRALDRNVGLRHAIARQLKELPAISPSGMYYGHHLTVELDHRRLNAVAEDIIKGLVRFEQGRALPPSHRVCAAPMMSQVIQDQLTPFAQFVRTGKRDWPGVFEYRVAVCDVDPQSSVWFLRFLGRICYWGLTAESTKFSVPAAN